MKHRRFRRLFRFTSRSARDVRDDVREELRCHLEMKAAALEAEGLDPQAARHARSASSETSIARAMRVTHCRRSRPSERTLSVGSLESVVARFAPRAS